MSTYNRVKIKRAFQQAIDALNKSGVNLANLEGLYQEKHPDIANIMLQIQKQIYIVSQEIEELKSKI